MAPYRLTGYISMVSQKNSLALKQFQLNILEKERAIMHKKNKLRHQLQKFSDLDDSQKTESMQLEEKTLLQDYVTTCKEKNELVHDLDGQEKLIAEDKRIHSFIANHDRFAASIIKSVPNSNKKNILNEFFDFFKMTSVTQKPEVMHLEEKVALQPHVDMIKEANAKQTVITNGQLAVQVQRSTKPCNTPDKTKITQQEQTNSQSKGWWGIKKQEMKSKMPKLKA